jgi:hypothetical protein
MLQGRMQFGPASDAGYPFQSRSRSKAIGRLCWHVLVWLSTGITTVR